MNAKITYQLGYKPHPWNDKLRAQGVKAWTLFQVTTPEMGPQVVEPVAIFNYDSDAERFQGHVFAEGLDEKLVAIDPQLKDIFQRRAASRPK